MASGKKIRPLILISLLILSQLPFISVSARDYYITGTVTDISGNVVPDARVSILAGTTEYASKTGVSGRYSIRLSGIYENTGGTIEAGMPFPNPFSGSVNIPFIISMPGDIRFSVCNLSGQKVMEASYDRVFAGSYRMVWDGCNQNGVPQKDGFYIYVLEFRGQTVSGKLIKAPGFAVFSDRTALEPVMIPPSTSTPGSRIRLKITTTVSCTGYYPVRLTDITIARDTVIDFELTPRQELPFKTAGDYIAMHTGTGYRMLILKGINLGSSPPGFFPGEIAYAISPEYYAEWIREISEAGFNSIRVYTLHPPVFYEKLAEYNQRHADKPLLLFQGIWLDETEDRNDPASYDLTGRIAPFTDEIHEVIDCINGAGNLAHRYGKAYGKYLTDVSRWTAGYIIGREISPQEVESTNSLHPSQGTYAGRCFSITGATATEAFIARMLDETATYEEKKYSAGRPVSFSSWPTLDPLDHPTEIFTDEDAASFDLTRITMNSGEPGIFASYHAYPYYPNFISEQPSYHSFSDADGQNSYLGYLNDLKAHYSSIPLVIAEFGVPSSWGSAHQSFSGMHHGGFSDDQQGEINMRLMHNIINSGCAGGFMFAWMDEWFKPTWIVLYLEAFGITSANGIIPTRQLWHNKTSPEQNFGLLTFEQQSTLPFVPFETDNTDGPLKKVSATHDNQYFFLEIESRQEMLPGDTVFVAFDTYLRGLGESKLPNGKTLANRSEFLLSVVLSSDTALLHVAESYNMYGLTPRFDLSNHAVQKFRSTVTDGSRWDLMRWINDEHMMTIQDVGKLPAENNDKFTDGKRTAVAWGKKSIKIRIPWTLLYFHDPTQMRVIDGAVSYDGGYNYEISTALSDGIAVSVYFGKTLTSSLSRYVWPTWLIAPATKATGKKSLQKIRDGLLPVPGFVE